MSRKRPRSQAAADEPAEQECRQIKTSVQNVEPSSEPRIFPVRWWLAIPGKDESLRSLVERADRLYGKPPHEGYAWESRPYGESEDHVDAPTGRELVRLARMLGTNPSNLHSHCLKDGPHLLETNERRAYCPRCLQDDTAAGRPRTFRRDWARVLVVSCAEHGTPLHWAEPRLSAEVNFGLEPSTPELAEEEREVLRVIDTFARTLDACLWGKKSWPATWRGSPQAARALLILCLCNLSWQRASPPVAYLWVPPPLVALIGFASRSRRPPFHGVPWDAVRRIGRPSWRRAALWLVAAQVNPEFPERCRPETIPAAYLAATNDSWDDFPPSPHTQKLRRVHAALRELCAPFPVVHMKSR